MTCAECGHGRTEAMARGKTAVRCFCPEAEPYWHGRVVLVVPVGCRPERHQTALPAWCGRRREKRG